MLLTEALSPFGWLTSTGLQLGWFLVAVTGAGLAWRQRTELALPALPPVSWPAALVPIVVLGLTLVIVLVAAPNSYDGLTYHLGRVAHWADNGSVRHYPTSVTRQLFMPPGAEYAILHLYVLTGSDRVAALPAWLAFAGLAVASSLLTARLGGDRRAQWFAAMLVLTLPTAIPLATSTQNDLVAAWWLLAALVLLFGRAANQSASTLDWCLGALAFGIAILTKYTVAIVAAPVLVWIAVREWRHLGPRHTALRVLIGTVLVVAPMAGHVQRNLQVFHHPLAEPAEMARLSVRDAGVAPRLVNTARHLYLHAGTPQSAANAKLYQGMLWLHRIAGVEPDAPSISWSRFNLIPWSTQEDGAGSGIALLLLAVALGLLFRRDAPREARWWLLASLAGFILLTWMIKWQPFGARLHVAAIAIALPAAAIALLPPAASIRRSCILAALLTLVALPSLFFNILRPVAQVRWANLSPNPSIFAAPRELEYFNYWPWLAPSYVRALQHTLGTGCTTLGLRSGADTWEYPLWALPRIWGYETRIRHVALQGDVAALPPESGPVPCRVLVITRDSAVVPDPAAAGDWVLEWREMPVSVWAPRGLDNSEGTGTGQSGGNGR